MLGVWLVLVFLGFVFWVDGICVVFFGSVRGQLVVAGCLGGCRSTLSWLWCDLLVIV